MRHWKKMKNYTPSEPTLWTGYRFHLGVVAFFFSSELSKKFDVLWNPITKPTIFLSFFLQTWTIKDAKLPLVVRYNFVLLDFVFDKNKFCTFEKSEISMPRVAFRIVKVRYVCVYRVASKKKSIAFDLKFQSVCVKKATKFMDNPWY